MIKLLILLIIPGFLYSQKKVDSTVHTINARLIQYHYLNRTKLVTVRPIEKIKITFKCMANFKSISSKVKANDLGAGELQGAFSDIEFNDYISVVRYDLRLKYYINYRSRFVARMQFLGPNRNLYTAGVQLKLKTKKHKIITEV